MSTRGKTYVEWSHWSVRAEGPGVIEPMHEGEALRLEDEAAAALGTLRDKPQDVTLLSTWDVFFACPFFGAAVSHPLQTLMRRRISPSGEGVTGQDQVRNASAGR